jgi:hypothetical protein
MSLASRKVSVDRSDLGIPQLLVSAGLLRLPRLGQFCRVAFTNPFTGRGAELGLLNLPRPPHSCRPVAGDAVALVKIMGGEEDAPPAWKIGGTPACVSCEPSAPATRSRVLPSYRGCPSIAVACGMSVARAAGGPWLMIDCLEGLYAQRVGLLYAREPV